MSSKAQFLQSMPSPAPAGAAWSPAGSSDEAPAPKRMGRKRKKQPRKGSLAEAMEQLRQALFLIDKAAVSEREAQHYKRRRGELHPAYKTNRKPLYLPKYAHYDSLKERSDGALLAADGTPVVYGDGPLPRGCQTWVKHLLWSRSFKDARYWRRIARSRKLMPSRDKLDPYVHGMAYARAVKLNRFMMDPDKHYQAMLRIMKEEGRLTFPDGTPMPSNVHFNKVKARYMKKLRAAQTRADARKAKLLMAKRLKTEEFGHTRPNPLSRPPEAVNTKMSREFLFMLKQRARKP